MKFESLAKERARELTQLFTSTFGASEGAEEGALIGDLVARLSASIDGFEIFCFGAVDRERLLGAIFFTRLYFEDEAPIYMLAPVAVSTGHQRSGVGKALIQHGLLEMSRHGALVAVTYGDPSYYEKFGFEPISEELLKAPMDLSMPHGWLGRSLTHGNIPPRHERPTCVEAFRNPAYW